MLFSCPELGKKLNKRKNRMCFVLINSVPFNLFMCLDPVLEGWQWPERTERPVTVVYGTQEIVVCTRNSC